jgi:hypothetical protein
MILMSATTAPTDYAAMNMPTLRGIAKTRGITVTAGVRKPDLIKVLTDSEPKAAPKPSPVRKDVKPADVTPDAEERSKEDVKRIGALENQAARMLQAAVTDSMKLANTLAVLYPLAPWTLHKQTPKQYFAALGIRRDNYIMPTDARRELVTLVYTANPDTPIEHVMLMTAASERSIKRDRADAGLINPNRSDAQRAAANARNAGSEEESPAAPSGPVTRMVPVVSMTSVREFINKLDDADMVIELLVLCEERATALTGIARKDDAA